MAHGDAREGKWRGNWRMEWEASTLHTTSERGVSSITTADAHTSAASSRLNWRPRRFKWTRPFRRKTKSCFCACAITFQTQSTNCPTLKVFQFPKRNLDSAFSLPFWRPSSCKTQGLLTTKRYWLITRFLTIFHLSKIYWICVRRLIIYNAEWVDGWWLMSGKGCRRKRSRFYRTPQCSWDLNTNYCPRWRCFKINPLAPEFYI